MVLLYYHYLFWKQMTENVKNLLCRAQGNQPLNTILKHSHSLLRWQSKGDVHFSCSWADDLFSLLLSYWETMTEREHKFTTACSENQREEIKAKQTIATTWTSYYPSTSWFNIYSKSSLIYLHSSVISLSILYSLINILPNISWIMWLSVHID